MFIPKDFPIPVPVETDHFRVRPITIHDVAKDYEAVMTSRDHLWQRFGETWGWPAADLSLEQDLIDLGWHQKEAQLRSTFNFAVMSLDEKRLLGCIYVDPPEVEGTEAEIWFWGRADELANGLEDRMQSFVMDWLNASWPFKTVRIFGKTVRLDRTSDNNS